MKLAVIGGGNMGGAVAAGAIRAGVVEAKDVVISHLEPKCDALFEGFKDQIVIQDDNAKAVEGADLVIVAVKPWMMEQIMGEIAPALDRERQAVVSIAAGITFEQLAQMLNIEALGAIGLYRIIPNTAIAIAQSVNFISKSATSAEHDAALLTIFGSLGKCFEIEESMMAPMTSLSSCGIAFAYKYIDASIEGGVEVGIDRNVALEVVLQTVRGALMMLETNGSMPQEEIDKVTTKGGITFKGLAAMERNGFVEAVRSGVRESR